MFFAKELISMISKNKQLALCLLVSCCVIGRTQAGPSREHALSALVPTSLAVVSAGWAAAQLFGPDVSHHSGNLYPSLVSATTEMARKFCDGSDARWRSEVAGCRLLYKIGNIVRYSAVGYTSLRILKQRFSAWRAEKSVKTEQATKDQQKV
jgi:hypothetical protein